MMDFLKRNWINGLGLLMVFTAFVYFLKLTAAQLNIPIELKLAVSCGLGSGLIFFGIRKFQNGSPVISQVLSGLGAAVIFSTIGFVSFSEEINWSAEALIATLGILVLISTYLADRYNMLILALIGTCGGILTPLFIQASENFDIALYIYLLILNLGALFLSIKKDWTIIRYLCFLFSIIIYAVYYHLFEPINWVKPFIYICTLFIIFSAGFLIASWDKLKSFNGIDLYLSILNSINFIYWSHFIFGDFEVSFIIPISIVGFIFISISLVMYMTSKTNFSIGALIYFTLGIISISICGSEMANQFSEGGMNYLIIAYLWLFILTLVYAIVRLIGNSQLILMVFFGFIALSVYWFSHAWSVDWLPIFGLKYIPFINLGAFLWIGLAVFGFSLSKYFVKNTLSNSMTNTSGEDLINGLSTLSALISHIVIGGLLTIQIMNLWQAYEIGFLTRGLMVSLMWFIYAVSLFIWSYNSKQRLFRILGIAVVLFSSLKVFVFDLNGESNLEKIIFLLVFGGVLFALNKINQKHQLSAAHTNTENTDNHEENKNMGNDTFYKKY